MTTENEQFYCFSAGCLALTSSLLNKTLEEVSNSARDCQQRWLQGNLDTFSVSAKFVDLLLYEGVGGFVDDDRKEDWLQQINVMTTLWWGFPKITRPSSRKELRELLIKSSHIPFATGWGLHRGGELDGGLSWLLHPSCDRTVLPPATWDVLSNVLNVNMGEDLLLRLHGAGVIDQDKERNATHHTAATSIPNIREDRRHCVGDGLSKAVSRS